MCVKLYSLRVSAVMCAVGCVPANWNCFFRLLADGVMYGGVASWVKPAAGCLSLASALQ